jgi:hypothetical protein
VTDNSNANLVSTADVEVKLMDLNDNKPVFQMEICEATFREDLSDLDTDEYSNRVIKLSLIATDDDYSESYSSPSIVYGLSSQIYDGLQIRTITSEELRRGELYIERDKFPFNFEKNDSYTIKVSCSSVL